MDTRSLGYLGLGALVVIVIVTLVGVPPAVWITAVLIAAGIGVAYAVLKARADGIDVARLMVARDSKPAGSESPAPSPPATASPATATDPTSDVQVELVRPADDAAGVPAVWLHRTGGRRVHRFEGPHGWVVEQVSTKDPDNPRKRVIGQPLTYAREADAAAAADDLARGVRPNVTAAASAARRTLTAEASA